MNPKEKDPIRTGFWRIVLPAGSLFLAGAVLAGTAWATEAPPPAVPEIQIPVSAEAAYQTGRAQTVRAPLLDEAIFTDISPLTVPEQAIRLPEDQQE